MIRTLLPSLAIAAGLALAGAAHAEQGPREATVYKSPYCGCCQGYVEHLEAAGFAVTVQSVDDIAAASRTAAIPEDMQGCHFAAVGGYLVSGHVPLSAVERLIDERPDIRGIALPGMPAGAPGMGGSKEGPLTVYTLGQGAPQVYAVE